MAEKMNMSRRWDDYRASKTVLFWSCTGCVVGALILGFTWGGWVTGGTAEEMAEETAEQARAQLAAAVCVHEFVQAGDASVQLASLKDLSSYRQGEFIEEGGWATMPDADEPRDDVADLCAEQLVELELPTQEAATINDEAKTVQ